ncbi:hypothetical protein QBC43DRAFT_53722 [Cladorrhinum sp. PSN259]|nr:hypothetical protein QBC43DRAFT_53722 [Cladorrhinum sp. PSN259]
MLSTISFLSLLGLTFAAPTGEASTIDTRQTIHSIQPTSWIDHPLYSSSPNTCYNPSSALKIWRNGPNPDKGDSALYTFVYPSGVTSANQCWLEFSAGPGATYSAPSVSIDVYSSSQQGSCTGGSSSNYRNNNWGRLNVPSSGGTATWAWTSGGLSTKQPCKAGGSTEWIELVAAGDNTNLQYYQTGGQGLVIKYQ